MRSHRHHDPSLPQLLPLDAVDEILTTRSLRPPAFRLVADGSPLPLSRYTRSGRVGGQRIDDLPDVGRVLELHRRGATIVLQGLHRWWEPVAALCRDLEAALTHPVQANAYVTPPDAAGFGVHHDTHDVLVLQTHGTKRWTVYEPVVEIPLARQGWDSAWDPGPPSLETELAPGDVLYLPRGTPHAAATLVGSSVHLTLGVRVVTWFDLLRGAIEEAADEPAFRVALPPGFAHDPDALAAAVATRMDELAGWVESRDPAALAGRQAETFWSARQPVLRGQLTAVEAPPLITDETVVRRRSGVRPFLRSDGDRLTVVLADRQVAMPAHAAEAVEELLAGAPVQVGTVPGGLDAAGRHILVHRLVREGALTVVASA